MRDALRTHEFDDLKLLAGMERELSPATPGLFGNWLVVSEWDPEWRYRPAGTFDREAAGRILDAVRAEPDGVLRWISSSW